MACIPLWWYLVLVRLDMLPKGRTYELLITLRAPGKTDKWPPGTRLVMAAREIETGEESDLHSPSGTRLCEGRPV